MLAVDGDEEVGVQDGWSEIERRSGTYHYGHEEGLEVGREQGLEQGRIALLEMLFEVLARRAIVVDAASEAQIRSCRDLAVLQRWLRRAMDATSLDELFERG